MCVCVCVCVCVCEGGEGIKWEWQLLTGEAVNREDVGSAGVSV